MRPVAPVANERWIILPKDYLVRQDNDGPSPDTGQTISFPYLMHNGIFLEGYHPRTKKRIHAYGPFDSIDDMETFAREHHIDLQAK